MWVLFCFILIMFGFYENAPEQKVPSGRAIYSKGKLPPCQRAAVFIEVGIDESRVPELRHVKIVMSICLLCRSISVQQRKPYGEKGRK